MRLRKMTPYLATAIAEGFCEGEGASEAEQLRAWQYLIDIGDCWQLQGWFGRTAAHLIEIGLCHAARHGAKQVKVKPKAQKKHPVLRSINKAALLKQKKDLFINNGQIGTREGLS